MKQKSILYKNKTLSVYLLNVLNCLLVKKGGETILPFWDFAIYCFFLEESFNNVTNLEREISYFILFLYL